MVGDNTDKGYGRAPRYPALFPVLPRETDEGAPRHPILSLQSSPEINILLDFNSEVEEKRADDKARLEIHIYISRKSSEQIEEEEEEAAEEEEEEAEEYEDESSKGND
ncbi:hypothetical protein ACHAPG_003460 [Botrytis cinerea]